MSFVYKFGGVVAALLVCGVLLWPVQLVTVRLPKMDDDLVTAYRVSAEDLIRLAYRHSVELTGVEGQFKVDADSEIRAIETRLESVGTGLPNAAPERSRVEGDWLVVDEEERSVGTLRFFLVPINQTRLIIADQPVSLNDLAPGTLIEIAAQRLPRVRWWLWSLCKVPFAPKGASR
jgi:hypothetical protein